MTKVSLVALALVLLASASVRAADLSPTDIVNRHMQAAAQGDLDAVLSDYADDAVVLRAGQATQGKTAIGGMFKALAVPGQKTGIKPTKVWAEGEVGFVTWERNAGTPGAVKGTDCFLVRHGKIVVQSVFIGEPAQP